ncbi:MAG: L-seryl-tRNA(Sec) selenium transferase, partial [Desulfobulbaceae bacterium]|nr:L-seryl-tRNA(Sec) selenium transferase [Desulfobulbaceae bacterium]
RNATTPDTGLFLKVHTSNFAVVGFTAEVDAMELKNIGKEFNIPVMADIGSGCLIDFSKYGLPGEKTVQEYVKAGIDVITFSGDKMLGGPQAGIIVGKKVFIDAMKKHQLLRALRVDKMTLAALEGTLRLYRDERESLMKIPTLRMLTVTVAELERRGKLVLKEMRRMVPAGFRLKLEHGFSQVGGGALPLLQIPTILIMVTAAGISSQKLEYHMRMQEVPVIGRINKGQFLLDLRTMLEDDVPFIITALRTAPLDVP